MDIASKSFADQNSNLKEKSFQKSEVDLFDDWIQFQYSSDADLVLSDGTLPVHTAILQTVSPFFQTIFSVQSSSVPGHRVIMVPDVSTSVMQKVLYLIYNQRVYLSSYKETEDVVEVIKFLQINFNQTIEKVFGEALLAGDNKTKVKTFSDVQTDNNNLSNFVSSDDTKSSNGLGEVPEERSDSDLEIIGEVKASDNDVKIVKECLDVGFEIIEEKINKVLVVEVDELVVTGEEAAGVEVPPGVEVQPEISIPEPEPSNSEACKDQSVPGCERNPGWQCSSSPSDSSSATFPQKSDSDSDSDSDARDPKSRSESEYQPSRSESESPEETGTLTEFSESECTSSSDSSKRSSLNKATNYSNRSDDSDNSDANVKKRRKRSLAKRKSRAVKSTVKEDPNDNPALEQPDILNKEQLSRLKAGVKECQKCKRQFKTIVLAYRCLRSHKKVRCYFCLQIFRSSKELMSHYRRSHEVVGRKQVQCPFCTRVIGFSYVSKHIINTHLRKLRGTVPIEDNENPTPESSNNDSNDTETVPPDKPPAKKRKLDEHLSDQLHDLQVGNLDCVIRHEKQNGKTWIFNLRRKRLE